MRFGLWAWLAIGAIFTGSTSTAEAQAPPIEARPAEYEALVERDIMIPVRDGVRLAADVYRPARDGSAAPGRFPTLLTRTPYSKGDGKSAEGRYYAERGYVVVVNDVRGRYASEGAWRLIVDDPADGHDVVEWIALQPWSNGRIGTFGTSYPGGTQHALAETRPPHLTTMVPIDAMTNCGIAGMRHGGAFELRFVNWIFQIGAPNSRKALAEPPLHAALVENGRRIREHLDQLPLRPGDSPLAVVPEYESWIVQALRTGPEDPFWHVWGMSVVDHVGDYADVPVLHVTGWYDSWTRQTTLSYEALHSAGKPGQRLVIGPWTHGSQGSNIAGEVVFTDDARLDLLPFRLRWYDRWMRDQRNGTDDDPPVRIYVMGTGDDHRTQQGLFHGGYWREEREWPPARARRTELYLGPDGTLDRAPPTSAESRTTYMFDPSRPVPTIGGNISSSQGLMTSGGFDQRPRDDTHAAEDRLPLSERRDVLTYRTEPLEHDLEVTGTVEVKLWVSSSAPDTDFTAKLIDEIPPSADYPLGFSLNLTDSILRLRYREGLDHQAPPLNPGQVVPITITLYPTSNVFKRGHRVRVDISSSNYPRFDVNPNTAEPLGRGRVRRIAENTVWHDAGHPSHVALPVIP